MADKSDRFTWQPGDLRKVETASAPEWQGFDPHNVPLHNGYHWVQVRTRDGGVGSEIAFYKVFGLSKNKDGSQPGGFFVGDRRIDHAVLWWWSIAIAFPTLLPGRPNTDRRVQP